MESGKQAEELRSGSESALPDRTGQIVMINYVRDEGGNYTFRHGIDYLSCSFEQYGVRFTLMNRTSFEIHPWAALTFVRVLNP